MEGTVSSGRTAEWMLRLFVGGVFLYAGVVKLLDPDAFLDNVLAYQLLQRPAAWGTALALPWLETMAGLAVIFGRPFKRGSVFILMLLSAAFLGLQIYAWSKGLDINCGCFKPGADNQTNYPLMVALDSALLASAFYLLRKFRIPATEKFLYEA